VARSDAWVTARLLALDAVGEPAPIDLHAASSKKSLVADKNLARDLVL
jgi:hypothetical protein